MPLNPAMMQSHFKEAVEGPDQIEEEYREKSRLNFENEWPKARDWWFSLPDGVNGHYTKTPRNKLLELWCNDRASQTKALARVLFDRISFETIYPITNECRALVGDPRLAEYVNRPGKVRAYGYEAERAAWCEFTDKLRRPIDESKGA